MANIDTQIIFDKNGNPIPQYLDVADKSGGSAGTMKPITGQNGAQFTQLTGSNVEIYNNGNFQGLMSNEVQLLSSQGFTLLDVRKTKERIITLQNNHDVAVRVTIQSKNQDSNDSLSGPNILDPQSIPSGGRLEISGLDYPELNLPLPFLRVRLSREVQPQSGRLLIYIFGGAY